MLLGNVPEYLFWLGAAALTGSVVVGINPTRRGEALAGDVRRTDCQVLVTDADGAALLDGLDTGVPAERVLRVDTGGYAARLADHAATRASDVVAASVPAPADLFLLLFTSGTTGAPKAVRCTQGRLASIALRSAEAYGYGRDDVAYCAMPLFHGNALMVLWGPTLAVGATVALARRSSVLRVSFPISGATEPRPSPTWARHWPTCWRPNLRLPTPPARCVGASAPRRRWPITPPSRSGSAAS